jgi:hypothetical protein
MDNAPSHTSDSSKTFILANRINQMRSPPQSPDFNPIELVWHDMKVYLSERVKPKTLQELIDDITEFWETVVTVEYCNRKIDHLERVFNECIKLDGKATGM